MEISKPQSRPFVVVTVYRPPDASSDFLSIPKTLCFGDRNCDLFKPIPDHPTKTLQSFLQIYQLSQLIDEATWVAKTSFTLSHLPFYYQ